MTNPTLERAARAAADVYFGPDVVVAYPTSSVWTDVARAVLMAVRELPEGFISQRRKLFESTEYLEYDFTTVLDEILNDEEQ